MNAGGKPRIGLAALFASPMAYRASAIVQQQKPSILVIMARFRQGAGGAIGATPPLLQSAPWTAAGMTKSGTRMAHPVKQG